MSTAAVVERAVAVATITTPRGAASVVVRERAPVATVVAGQGPAGPPGPAGAARRYEHPQLQAAAVWTVAHNLGARPQVAVLTVGGVLMLAAVQHLSENTLQVVLDDPQAGLAICT